MSFLSAVAQYFVDSLAPEQWEHTIFVFPNQRSGVFFSNTLCSLLGETEKSGSKRVIFGLNITTLGDLLRKNSDITIADRVTLRCELYNAYKKVFLKPEEQRIDASDGQSADVSRGADRSRTSRHDFDSFYSWAGIIVNDFSDIDRSLVDPLKIYGNITSLQQLSDEMDYLSDRQREAIEDFWHVLFEVRVDELGDKKLVHRRFVEDFRKMDALYNVFRQNLLAKDMVYPSMLLRQAAEKPLDWQWDEDGAHYVFIGFSLLCPAEEAIMRRLSRSRSDDGRPRADFFWDYQPSMLSEPESVGRHGAGYAVRRWATDPDFKAPFGFTPPIGVPPDEQKITLIETAYSFSQASVVADILSRRSSDDNSSHSVIVLPDQQMLLPVMSAIPSSVTDINVTMGYDLRFAQVSSFLRLVSNLLNPLWLRLRHDSGDVLFNVKALLPVLRHPYTIRCDGLKQTRRVVKKVIDGNMAFVSRGDFAELKFVSLVLSVVPSDVKSLPVSTTELPVERLSATLQSILISVYNTFAEAGERDLDRETVWEALKVVRRLGSVFDLVKDDVSDVRLLMRILCSMVEQQNVDFQGMPFGGLQIMGILETRAIDFDDVVILDMIEGAWPPPRQSVETMIPLFLRNANRMPTPDDVESTYNYYFYRLKSRAKNLTLIRPTAVSGTRQSQLSRYVLQIEKLYKQKVEVVSAQNGVLPHETRRIVVDKHSVADILARDPFAEDWRQRGLRISPSGLSDYISCPLLFYFKRIANLRVDDEINEEADDRQLGLIYHAVMESLYKPQGVVLSDERIKYLLSKEYEPTLDRLILDNFSEVLHCTHLASRDELNGRNILTFFTLKKLIRLTLETEQPGTIIVNTEERVDNLPIALPSGRVAVLNGSVDRQHIAPSDSGDGDFYVADYKTGRVDKMKIDSLVQLFVPDEHEKNKAILQVMMYCYFLRHKPEKPVTCPMVPYVLKVKSLSVDLQNKQSWLSSGGVANPSRLAYIKEDDGSSKKKDVKLVYSGEVEAEFEKLLANKIDELYNLDIPFTQVENPKRCEKCDFLNICRR